MNQKAVIYARYSSDKQTEQSIDGQLRECNDFAKRNNITVIGQYIDRALTGTTDKRPEFLKMIEDGKKKIFNYVIVYQLDRFARNRFDSATYKAKLSRNNIRVLSARENITDDASGVLVEGVLESMAEYFSKELSQKVTRGMKESLLKGNWTGGRLTYGYDIKDKKYVINEEESRIVREIFEGVIINKTLKQITKELNEKGFRNKQGSMFSLAFVSRLVRNKKYIGYISDSIETKDLIEPIIDQDTFDIVQDRLSPHKRKPAQHKAPLLYYLSGKTYCGNCGNLVTADSGTSNTGTIYRYYKCSNRKKNKHACNKKMIGKELLEGEVINKTVEEIFKPELLKEIAENIVKTFNNEIKDDYQVKSYQNQIDDVSKKIENIMKAIEEGIITSTTKEKLLAYESLKADLLEQIATAKNKSIKPLELSEVMAFLKGFAELDYSKEENRTRLLEMFIHKIYLYDDFALIAYKGTNNPVVELKLEHKKTERELLFEFGSIGAPIGIRTPDLCVRSATLYPAELMVHDLLSCRTFSLPSSSNALSY